MATPYESCSNGEMCLGLSQCIDGICQCIEGFKPFRGLCQDPNLILQSTVEPVTG